MSTRKIIAVLGATGAQGGGLARAILDDPHGAFALRAVTRDTGSDAAKALAKRGAEVVAADVDDEKSLERAFAGAHGVYAVTFFWAHMQPEREIDEARKIAAAAKAAGVKHLVWSTLEDTRRWVPLSDTRMPTLQGKYKVPHFDAKGEANALFVAAGVPTTFLNTSFYWDNLIHFGMGPAKGADGQLGFTLPMGAAKLPGIASEDIGKCAYGIFKRGGEFIGKTVGISGEHLSGAEMAASLTRALGRPVRHHDVSPETYRGFGFPGADDLGNMFQFKHDFE
ncbi:MAG: NmrA/HSCARG family protein, partial [Betaproteobacteria bacterium]